MVRSITIKDEYVPELIEVFGKSYEATITDEDGNEIDNPQTKAQYASETFNKEWRNYIKRRVQNHRQEVARAEVNEIEIVE
jgi:predicted metal-dependent hydrolase